MNTQTTRYTVSETTANYLDCKRSFNALESALFHALCADFGEPAPDGTAPQAKARYNETFAAPMQAIAEAINASIAGAVSDNLDTPGTKPGEIEI